MALRNGNSPLGSLTTNVKELVCQLANDKVRLGDTGRFDTGSEDVLVGRDVFERSNTVDRVKIADLSALHGGSPAFSAAGVAQWTY